MEELQEISADGSLEVLMCVSLSVYLEIQWVACTTPPPPPLTPGNSSLGSYFASKILTFKIHLPLEISDDLPWGGHGDFLKLRNIRCLNHRRCPLGEIQPYLTCILLTFIIITKLNFFMGLFKSFFFESAMFFVTVQARGIAALTRA